MQTVEGSTTNVSQQLVDVDRGFAVWRRGHKSLIVDDAVEREDKREWKGC